MFYRTFFFLSRECPFASPRGTRTKGTVAASHLYTPFMTADDAREPIADEEKVKKGRALFVWHAVIAIVGVFAANARRESA